MTVDSMPSSGFQTIKAASRSSLSRLGVLNFKSNAVKPLHTPAFLCPTSRGVISHLTPDNVIKCEESLTRGGGVLLTAEDFMEKAPAQESPLLKYPGALKDLLSLPHSLPVAVSPRRSIPVPSPQTNFDDKISIMTSEGFRYMPIEMYLSFVEKTQPDLVFSIPDIPNLSPGGRPGSNRARKMLTRTEKWLNELLDKKRDSSSDYGVFAPVLPGLPADAQLNYLNTIKADSRITGITLWNSQAARLSEKQAGLAGKRDAAKHDGVALNGEAATGTLASYIRVLGGRGEDNMTDNDYEEQECLSRLAVCYGSGLETPHEILDFVSGGVDIFMATGISQFTDSGVALDFTFPANAEHPFIGYNLWETQYATDMTSLGRANIDTLSDVSNYYRAYVHHLLEAREMTSWVILQMHNIVVFDRFFQGIRECIENETFDLERERFTQIYGASEEAKILRDLYKKKDTVPKVRGYTISYDAEVTRRAEGSSQKLNDSQFKRL